MRAFLLVTCLVGAVVARPEAGYIYNGLPQAQNLRGLPMNSHPAQAHGYQQLPQEQNFANFGLPPQMVYLPPSQEQLALQPAVEPSAGPASAPLNPQENFEDSYNMAHRLSSVPHASGYSNGPTETKVHKHIYVHVPPKDFEEEDAVQPRVHHQAGPKQKHYKIVFIKAPAAPAIRAPIVAPPPPQEEKTLIYVLHKKPEDQQDIVIPTPAPTKPSKPEVYFIKYKTKKEEAPVYGPPPADMEPRHAGNAEDLSDLLPATTVQTLPEVPNDQQQQQQQQQQPQQPQEQLVNELPNVYGAPTSASYTGDEVQTTIAAPNSQYLPPSTATSPIGGDQPSMAPIIVSEEQQSQQQQQQARLPAQNYGPPNRFFIKKRK